MLLAGTLQALLRQAGAHPQLRLLSTVAPNVTQVHLHKQEKVLVVSFEDGVTRRFSAELLRCTSPAADNAASPWRRGGALAQAAPAAPAPGQPKVVAGRRHVGIMSVEPVGRYALRLRFDDLHDGIFPFDFLRELGDRRLDFAKHYIRALRAAGLSRDPSTARGRRQTAAGAAAGKGVAGRGGGGCKH